MQDRDVVAAVERDHVGRNARARLQLDHGVLLSRDYMRSRHDQIRPPDPAGALDTDAAGSAENANDARRRARERRPRARDAGPEARPERRVRRSSGTDRCGRAHSRISAGGTNSFSRWRSAERCAPRRGRSAPAAGARPPRAPTRPRGPRAAPRTSPPVASNVLSLRRRTRERRAEPGQRPERLEQDRTDGGAGQRGERRVRRARSVLKELRGEPRSEPGPEHDPGRARSAVASSPSSSR